MPKFSITTDDNGQTAADEELMDFPDEKAATDDAQVALAEMARDRLPNGSQAQFCASVKDEAGDEVYRASLDFKAQTGAEMDEGEKLADSAADRVAQALGGPRQAHDS